jgi:hypothetical protein
MKQGRLKPISQKEFEAIDDFDVIHFQRDEDPELERGSVMKDSDKVLLVGGIDGKVGFWHPVTREDVYAVEKFGGSGGSDVAAIKTHIKNAQESLDNALALTE